MPLDTGVLTIWRGENISPSGNKPQMQYTKVSEEYYEQKTVGITRWYTAQQHGDRPDIVVQIHRRYDISTAYDRVTLSPYAYNDSGSYKINQIQQIIDPENLPMTMLTLERDDGIDADKLGNFNAT